MTHKKKKRSRAKFEHYIHTIKNLRADVAREKKRRAMMYCRMYCTEYSVIHLSVGKLRLHLAQFVNHCCGSEKIWFWSDPDPSFQVIIRVRKGSGYRYGSFSDLCLFFMNINLISSQNISSCRFKKLNQHHITLYNI